MTDKLYEKAAYASWVSDECATLFGAARRLAAGTGSIEEVEGIMTSTFCNCDEYYDVVDYANAVISSARERA